MSEKKKRTYRQFPTRQNTPEKFWTHVEKTETCWNWTGCLDRPNGYGVASFLHKVLLAHRLSYQLLVGEIPKGLVIDHICRNKRCVNPSHLRPVTSRMNVLYGIGPSAVNARKTHCIRGHEFAGDNLRMHKGKRYCKKCSADRYQMSKLEVAHVG